MGIRFACHVCGKRLNIKRQLAGKRGVCPSCANRFRIPWEDSEKSIPLKAAKVGAAAAGADSPAAIGATADSGSIGGSASLGASTSSEMIEDALADTPAAGAADFPSSILDEDPGATWYVRPPSGGQYGPASSEILREWIQQGRVAAAALIWRDGWPQWREASDSLPELVDRLPNGGVASTTKPPGVAPSSSNSPQLSRATSASASKGTDRVGRSKRRVTLIGILSAVAVALIGVLVIVVNR